MMVERDKGFLRVHPNLFSVLRAFYEDCPPKRFGKYQLYIWKIFAYFSHSVISGKISFSIPSHVNIDRVFIPIPLPIHRIIKNPTKDKIKGLQRFMNESMGIFFRVKIKKNIILLRTCYAIFVGLKVALKDQKGFVKIPLEDFSKIENIYDFICVFYKNSLCKKYDEIVFNKVIKEWSFIFNKYKKRNEHKLLSRLKESASKFGFRFFTMDDSNILYLKDFRHRRRHASSPQRGG